MAWYWIAMMAVTDDGWSGVARFGSATVVGLETPLGQVMTSGTPIFRLNRLTFPATMCARWWEITKH